MKKIIHIALTSIRKNWLPGFVLQLFGIIIVLAYYFVPSFHTILEQIAGLKESGGYWFSAIATGLFAGFIPFLIHVISEKESLNRHLFVSWIYMTLFWAYRGMEVDLFYKLQACLYGHDLTFLTILKKTVTDQFFYAPLWSIFIVAVGVLFKDCRFSWHQFRAQLNRQFFFMNYPSIVFSTWVIWVPAVAIIYSLPLLLQVPMMNIVSCFYAILILYMTKHRKQ